MIEVDPDLDTATSTRAGGADPFRTAQAVLGRPGGETTGTEIEGVVATEGGQDPTVGHALPEGIEIEGIPETQTKGNSWVTMTLPRSLSESLLWKSKVGVAITRLR